MIVLVEGAGNHSNRLFQTIHYEAFCLEHQLAFVNLAFADMAALYPALSADPRFSGAWWIRKFHSWRLLPLRTFKTGAELEPFTKKTRLYVGGWDFRVHALTTKYRDHFSRRYRVSPDLLEQIPLFQQIQTWKKSGGLVVGVHIRRGDYRTWMEGKYFYVDSVYESCMHRMQELLAPNGRTVHFVAFSNEPVSLEASLSLTVSKNDWWIDHELMSRCDYLIGPPSTFTLWASYIGNTPYYHIQDPKPALSLSDFSICEG